MAKLPALIDRNFDPRQRSGITLRGSEVEQFQLTPFRDDHLSTDRYQQPDAGRKLDHGLWFRGHRRADPAHRLFQFHQPGHSQSDGTGARDIAAQGGGRPPPPGDGPVSRRIGADGADVTRPGSWRWWRCCFPFTTACWASPSRFTIRMTGRFFYRSWAWPSWLACSVDFIPRSSFQASGRLRLCRTNAAGQSGSGFLRSLLVVMQFAVSIGLGIAAPWWYSRRSPSPAPSISASTRTGSWWWTLQVWGMSLGKA